MGTEWRCGSLRHYFETLDLGDFDPLAPAPMSGAKAALQSAGHTGIETAAISLVTDPNCPSIFYYTELLNGVETECGRKPDSKALTNALNDRTEAREIARIYPNKGDRGRKIAVWGKDAETNAQYRGATNLSEILRARLEELKLARNVFFFEENTSSRRPKY